MRYGIDAYDQYQQAGVKLVVLWPQSKESRRMQGSIVDVYGVQNKSV